MAYTLNISQMQDAFLLPCSVVRKYLKLATPAAVKVILWICCSASDEISPEKAAAELGLDINEVNETLLFWKSVGMLNGEPENNAGSAPRQIAVLRQQKPSREETARRGLESKEIAFLLHEAEMKFGRTLRQNEVSTLVWLYDDEGIPAAAILMIIEYAISENRGTIGFVERTAVDWLNRGIAQDVRAVENEIVKMRSCYSAWGIVQSAMGIERRSPSNAELETAHLWVNEWHYSSEMLKSAYDRCVDATSKFSVPYIRKIIEKWHKSGVKTTDDLKKYESEGQKNAETDTKKSASYDIEKAMQSMF